MIEHTFDAMMQRLRASGQEADPTWLTWLGPTIGPSYFEVGEKVRQAFIGAVRPGGLSAAEATFREGVSAGKFFTDLYVLARLRLTRAGCTDAYGGGLCAMMDAERFYLYRRERITDRIATLI